MEGRKVQERDPWWLAKNGPNPYILPFLVDDDDYKWQCIQCRCIFGDIGKHWHEFHSKNGPNKQPFTMIYKKMKNK